MTVVQAEGAVAASRIFTAWADLFRVGPPTLHLTGAWTWVEGEPLSAGRYERLEFDRQETIDRLRILAGYAAEVADSPRDLYLLHLGI